MSTRQQLVSRWRQPPWSTVQDQIKQLTLEYAETRAEIERACFRQTGSYKVPSDREPIFDTSRFFDLLVGLPFRGETANGRDFRGSDFPGGGYGFDFRETDFSFLQPNVGHAFFDCDLFRARFDGSCGEFEFSGKVEEASFRKVRFIASPRMGTYFIGRFFCCDFTDAKIKRLRSLEGSDFRGSVFRGADLTRAGLPGCDLRGCDFRDANLSDAYLSGTILDKETDFRGANLSGVFCGKHTQGNFDGSTTTFAAIDLRVARHDGSTVYR